MLIGYACTSPDDPLLALQRKALMAAGCGEIFEERGSSQRVLTRVALRRALAVCAAGDVLVVWRLNLLGRSPPHAIEILHNLATRGVGARALTDEIDFTAPDALRLIHALAEFQYRTMTRRVGHRLRPPLGATNKPPARPLYRKPEKLTLGQLKLARRRIDSGETLAHLVRTMCVSYNVLWRGLAWLKNLPADG
jgi:DNA invertase Pin-like site-specific DNA recombinase